MKKILVLMMALAVILPVYSDRNKDLEKAQKKELKNKLKEYQKGKWEIMGSHTLEVALAEHYNKLNQAGMDAHEVEGISINTKSKNIGKQSAINNACITFAQEAGSTLQGRVIADMQANGIDPSGEFDNFYAAYERLVEKEIKNDMDPTYTIIRSNPDGTYEVRTYFVVAEDAAAKARQRALQQALKDSEAAQKYADKISDFVNQKF